MTHPYGNGGPAHPGYQVYPPPQQYYRPGTNGFAIASLVLSFFFIIGAILGMTFGLVALSQIRRTGEQGRGLALAGVTISSCWLGLVLFAIVHAITLASTS